MRRMSNGLHVNDIEVTPKLLARFWSKVSIKMDPTACWEWKGSRVPEGYGQIGICNMACGKKKRPARAHVMAMRIVHGEIPAGVWVLHSCDNPPCVNPHHLRFGTPADNAKDASERGRNLRHCPETIGTAIALRNAGVSPSVVADRLGVSPSNVSSWSSRQLLCDFADSGFPTFTDSGVNEYSIVAPSQSNSLVPELQEAMTELPERSRVILECRFGIGRTRRLTLEQIGTVYGITKERVRQIECTAMNQLARLLK